MTSRLRVILWALLTISLMTLTSKADVRVVWSDGKTGQISTDDLKRYRVSITPPKYPYEARRQRITGSGLFELRLDKAGSVKGIVIAKSTGDHTLNQAAMRALIKFRYKPGVFLKVMEPVTFAMTR